MFFFCVCVWGGGGSEFKPACNGVNTAWFPVCINKYTFLALIFLCTVHFVNTS